MSRRDHVLLAGDGWLLTAGSAAVALTIVWAASSALASVRGAEAVAGIGLSLLLLLGGMGGVLVTWMLHQRRIDWVTVLGAVAGAGLGGAAVPVVAASSALFGWMLSPVTRFEYAGPLAALVVLSAALLGLTGWLIVDAVRDLAPARRRHPQLDIARIIAAIVVAVFGAACAALVWLDPGPEQGELIIWAMAAGILGAGAIVGADIADTVRSRT